MGRKKQKKIVPRRKPPVDPTWLAKNIVKLAALGGILGIAALVIVPDPNVAVAGITLASLCAVLIHVAPKPGVTLG